MTENDVRPTTELGVPSGRKLIATVVATLIGALLVLVTVVLPAEYQIDPTGVGAAMGLMQLRGDAGVPQTDDSLRAAEPGVATSQDSPFRSEVVELEIAPGEEMEFKVAMSAGDTFAFSWSVTGGVLYSDFHAEPYGEPPGGAIRYEEKPEATESHGSLSAPFDGHHGWYWVNPGEEPLHVTLRISGFFDALKERRA